MTPLRNRMCGAACAIAIVTAGHAAFAQDASALAARRGLIEQAQTARNANNHEQALDLAERASRIQMSPSLRLFVAQEQYALHRIAEAYGNADACMREAEADTAARNREQVAQTCRALSQELRAQIGHVIVHPPSPAPQGLQITVNGNALTDALWAVPYVVTPGQVTIVAHAAGYRDFQQTIFLAAGAGLDVQVALQATQTASAAPPHVERGETVQTHEGAAPREARGGGTSVAPLVVAAVGVAAMIAGGLLFIPQQSEINATTGLCPNYQCPDVATQMTAQPHRDSAATWTYTAYGVGGAGIALATVGIIWFAVGRSGSNSHAGAAAFHVVPTGDGAVVGVSGMF